MEFIKKYQGFIAIGLAVLGLIALVVITNKSDDTNKAEADKKTAQKAEADKKAKTDTTKSTTAAVYNYVAQPGDSYSVLARKAVQTYGINEKIKLSFAQIIAAETQLTNDAGSIELNEGQTVALSQSAVKAAVDAVQKLSAEALAAWEVYVPTVDFNTNAAGQAQTK